MSPPAFNPDGSPNAALNAYRRRAIMARKDKGQVTQQLPPVRVLAATTAATCRPASQDAIDRLCDRLPGADAKQVRRLHRPLRLPAPRLQPGDRRRHPLRSTSTT